jgi:predicted DNA-binding transcriptional regulator YafY
MNEQICGAIRQRKLVRFSYDGKVRKVEPYCHGISIKEKEVLRGFQLEPQEGWRLFACNKMIDLYVSDQNFDGDRKEYNPRDSEMRLVYCCLQVIG